MQTHGVTSFPPANMVTTLGWVKKIVSNPTWKRHLHMKLLSQLSPYPCKQIHFQQFLTSFHPMKKNLCTYPPEANISNCLLLVFIVNYAFEVSGNTNIHYLKIFMIPQIKESIWLHSPWYQNSNWTKMNCQLIHEQYVVFSFWKANGAQF